jgi:DNA-binding transcriptional LysR family regulator
MDFSAASLRALQAVAEMGSVSAAARVLGYTQSAVSRQIASAEQEVGHRLFVREHAGVRLTREGLILLRHAAVAVQAMQTALDEINSTAETVRTIRLGLIPAAGTTLLTIAIALLVRSDPALRVTTRQGSTPGLLRAVRSGGLDLAVVTQRPPYPDPDRETPALAVTPILDTTLMVAVAANGPLGTRETVDAAELAGLPWISGLPTSTEPHLGVWPHLPGRPYVAHRANDWLVRLRLVAAGAGITTIPGPFLAALIPGVHAVRLTGAQEERRRVSAVHIPGRTPAEASAVLDALLLAAEELTTLEGVY